MTNSTRDESDETGLHHTLEGRRADHQQPRFSVGGSSHSVQEDPIIAARHTPLVSLGVWCPVASMLMLHTSGDDKDEWAMTAFFFLVWF